MKKLVVIIVTIFILVAQVQGQQISTGLSTIPQFFMPVGQKAENYNYGLGIGLEGLFSLVNIENFSASVDLGYAFVPLALGQSMFTTDTNLSLINLGLGLRGAIPLGERFSLFAKAGAGGSAAVLHGSDSGQAFVICWNAGGGVGFLLNSQLALQTGVSYVSYHNLYDGLAVNIGLITRFSGTGSTIIPRKDFIPVRPGTLPGGGSIQFMDAELIKVFPVLYKYYATHPIGSATVVNRGKKTVNDLEIRLEMAQYMDAPILSARIDQLEPGEEKPVDIYALFTEEILSITEGAKLASELKAEYNIAGAAAEDITLITLDTWHRNAMTWDDNRKIAAFVTARDEEIQKTARNVASIVRDEGLSGFNSEFQLAMALLSVMDVFGCTYVIDPSSSYSDLSQEINAVDTVQFPRQTLQYRAGDCDDLSSTYNALLEAVGVETAFITVPGHIYTAFKLDISAAEAKRTFSRSYDLIYPGDDSVWLPIETTALQQGFMKAWALGSRQWREHDVNGNAELLPVREAWQTYEPVAFGISNYELEIPDRAEVVYLFSGELENYIDQEIVSRERGLLAQIDRDPSDKRSMNSLGVLYARYGRTADAQQQFKNATPHPPAYINLGNLAYLNGRAESARDFYQKALEASPEYPAALLGLARVFHSLEKFDNTEALYERLRSVAPELAQRFIYLTGEEQKTDRASSIVGSETIYWDE